MALKRRIRRVNDHEKPPEMPSEEPRINGQQDDRRYGFIVKKMDDVEIAVSVDSKEPEKNPDIVQDQTDPSSSALYHPVPTRGEAVGVRDALDHFKSGSGRKVTRGIQSRRDNGHRVSESGQLLGHLRSVFPKMSFPVGIGLEYENLQGVTFLMSDEAISSQKVFSKRREYFPSINPSMFDPSKERDNGNPQKAFEHEREGKLMEQQPGVELQGVEEKSLRPLSLSGKTTPKGGHQIGSRIGFIF
jgi:hypothetical protein